MADDNSADAPGTGENRDDDAADIHKPTPDDHTVVQAVGEWFWDQLVTWGPALLVVLLIRSVVAEPFRIPSGSMVPTLAIGDHILVTKYSYGLRIPLTRIPVTELKVPERGDVVVFVYPGSDDDSLSFWADLPVPPFATLDYVKRVVGLPGDSIEVRDNVLYINGKAQARESQGDYRFVDDRCTAHATTQYEEDLGGVEHAMLTATAYGARMRDFGPETVPDGHIFAMGDNRDHSADSRVWGFVPLRNIKGKARFVWLSFEQCGGNAIQVRNERIGEPVR